MQDTNFPTANFQRAERGARIMLGYMADLRNDRFDQPVFIFANLLGDLHSFAAFYGLDFNAYLDHAIHGGQS
jgi:hypothetical protein